MTTFSSGVFSLQSAVQVDAFIVRVRFTYDPKVVSAGATNDALNPFNYAFVGPNAVTVTGVVPVAADTQAVDVHVDVPFAIGAWVVTVAATLVSAVTLTTISGSRSANFDVLTASAQPGSPAGGAVNNDAESLIRTHLPSVFQGKAWKALIAGLGVGDQYNRDLAKSAFDQLFRSSASDVYLDRRASNDGVERPRNLGMPDELFRKYTVKQSVRKITEKALVDLLEIFYGTDLVTAHLDSVAEPFVLSDGQTLRLTDDHSTTEVVFSDADFKLTSVATAEEVAIAITRWCRQAKFKAHGEAVNNASGLQIVRIRSDVKGMGSALSVTGGVAQSRLLFPSTITTTDVSIGSTFSVSVPKPGVARYTALSTTGTPFLNVRPGDYVNVIASAFATTNKGSFPVLRAFTSWNGASYDQFFEVPNNAATAQGGPLTTVFANDVQFFRPVRASVYTAAGSPVLMAQDAGGGFKVILPATTQAVGRSEHLAAYLQPRRMVNVSGVVVTDAGVATVTTPTLHGLTTGQQVILEGLKPTLSLPATVAGSLGSAGNPGTTDASQLSLWSALRSDFFARTFHSSTLLSTGDVMLTGGLDGAGTRQTASTRFRITSTAILLGGAADGRPQYTYNWIATAALPAARSFGVLTGLFGQLAGKALYTGGQDAGGVAQADARLYDATGNAWANVPVGALTARFAHNTVRVLDATGDDVVYIIGGNTAANVATGDIQRFTSAAGGTISLLATEAAGRGSMASVASDANTWVVAGGLRYVAGTPFLRDDCLAYNELTASFLPVGRMATARKNHSLVKLRDGQVMVFGGLGHNLANETTDRELSECEILEVATGKWRPTGHLKFPRSLAAVMVANNKVYVTGGFNAISGDRDTVPEIYDIDTGTWSTAPSTANDITTDTSVFAAVVAMPQGLFSHGGQDVPGGGTLNTARLLVPGSLVVTPKASLNTTVKIATVPSTSTFTLVVATDQAATLGAGALEIVAAAPKVFDGPYVWDPFEGVPVTGTKATLQQTLREGGQYKTLLVDSSLAFPDAPGWLALAFGTSNEVAPVRYFGRQSPTELIIDYTFHFPRAIASGSKVHLLAQRTAFVPEDPVAAGSFYITPSSDGRVAAQAALEEAAAAGVDHEFTVAYPSDVGLGNAGLGPTGQKLSDEVYVWGGEDPDAEIATARES